MRLKSIELVGFKSFVDRTVIQFQPGVTAIVGPNGAGKSNIADAILWVIGEQSAKTLRGERMEDIIFNGSEQRKAYGMSEVTLHITGLTAAEGPASMGEVALTRRLYRSGESEYLINKVACRLKDIRDLLADVGTGARGTTVIEQGKVEEIVTASPVERRALIEEAAGIARFKVRVAEAERRLETTQQDLLRVQDIVREVARQMGSLDRQAKRAARYREARERLSEKELALARFEFDRLSAELAAIHATISDAERREQDVQAALAAEEARAGATRARLVELEREAAEAARRLEAVERERLAIGQRRNWLGEQRAEWVAAAEQSGRDRERMAEESTAAEARAASLIAERNRLMEAVRAQQALIAASEEQAAKFRSEMEAAGQERERLEALRVAEAAEAAQVRNRLTEITRRLEEAGRHRERLDAERTIAEEGLTRATAALDEGRTGLAGIAARLNERRAEEQRIAQACETTRSEAEDARSQAAALREEERGAEVRLQALRDLEGWTGSIDAPRQILRRLGAAGRLVADILVVPEALERAVEAVLGDRLHAVVVDDPARVAREWVRPGQVGRVVLVPTRPRLASAPRSHPARLIDQVGIRPGFEAVARALLGDVVLIEALDHPDQVWRDHPGTTLVTREGEVIEPSGTLTAGGPSDPSGLLRRQGLIEELEGAARRCRAGAEAAQATEDAAAQKIARLETERAAIQAAIRELELEHASRLKAIELAEAERSRLQGRLELLRLEIEERAAEIAGLEAEQRAAREADAQGTRNEEEIEAAWSKLEAWTAAAEQGLAAVTGELAGLRRAGEALGEQHGQLQVAAAEAQARAAALRDEAHQRESRQAELLLRIEGTRREEVDCARRTGELDTAHAEISRSLEAGRGRSVELRNEIASGEDRAREHRASLERARADRHRADLQAAETTLRRNQIVESVREGHRIEIEHLPVPAEGFDPEATREVIRALKEKIEEIGPVHLGAIEEYRELEERHTFLTRQQADLEQSIADLREAIVRLSRTSGKMFRDTFEAVNARFGEVFRTFFEGGQAEIRLVEAEGSLPGIEIYAQPPGKRLRTLALLSGGEKALTAIALLFATLLVQGSPFCVLDEIDAPLDEENIRRFTTTLRRMTDRSQFLVVTHNRRTMETADLLYGVTMEEPGISKLVSVRLGEAEEEPTATFS